MKASDNMKTWKFIDKSKWPERGEWDNEPDKAQWTDEASGLVCLALRNHGNWCGYVGVPEGHPAYGGKYDNVDSDVDVHGGLTFGGFCQKDNPEHGICHIPEPGLPNNLYWLGFDCAHGGDKRPATNDYLYRFKQQYPAPEGYETYKTLDYVRAECASLAKQLKAMTP